MTRVIAYLRQYRDGRKHVRPWALAVPILVLLVCLPQLRPLRHPEPADDEVARLATVQAIVERGTQSIDFVTFKPGRPVIRVGDAYYSDQPPAFAALLASAYWSMHRLGLRFDTNPALVTYLLTVIGTTLPAAGVAGLAYRMARMFELSRPWRMLLAGVVVFGSGLLSYATTLNEHVPAAALVTSAAACLVHVAVGRRRHESAWVWLVVAGLAAGLAATVDVVTGAFVPLLAGVVLAMPWRRKKRAGGLAAYALGLAVPFAMHCALTIPVTGDWRPGTLHPELAANLVPDAPGSAGAGGAGGAAAPEYWNDDLTETRYWATLGRNLGRVATTLVGDHGLIAHFPVLLFGAAGVTMVMHRHWPAPTKMLAAATGGAALVVVLIYALTRPRWDDAGYAVRYFIAFAPLLTFWAGAWLRKPHRPLAWAVAGIVTTFSVIVSLIGATGPLPRDPFVGYTAADALDRFLSGAP